MLAISIKRLVHMKALTNAKFYQHALLMMLLVGQNVAVSGFSTEAKLTSVSNPMEKSTAKRIAIVGAGAVGSYYGGRIWESLRDQDNADVMFHLRNEHYEYCTENGIDVTSCHGNFSIPAKELLAYSTTHEMAKAANSNTDHTIFDWVICSLKSTSLDDVPTLIEPLLSPETRVLVIMNGLIEDDLIQFMRDRRETQSLDGVGCKAIYGGMALICSNRLAPGKIDHSYGGKLVAGVAYSADANSDRGKWSSSDKEAILDLFSPVTTVPFEFETNLLRGRWWKNVWNLPFSGLSCAMGGITVDKIVNDPGLRRLAFKIIDETIAIANADILRNGASKDELLGDETRDEMMTLSDGMGAYKTSTMLDYHSRKPMEVKYLFRKAVERANDLEIPCPCLETAVEMIEYYQRQYGLY